MKKRLQRLRERLREPKWRHGRLSAALLGGFALMCILLVVGIQALEDHYGWERDLSFNAYTTTGEQTQDVLERLEREVNLYLLYQGTEEAELWQVLKRYDALSPLVTAQTTDIAQNPGFLSLYEGDSDHTPQAGTVVVDCPDTGRYRLLDYTDFQTVGYDISLGEFVVEGLAYEKELTEAIAYVAQDDVPTMGVLSGHGELTLEALEAMVSFLRSNGYDSREVSLLSGDTLDGVDVLLLACPQKDLTDEETQALSDYAQQGGSLLVLRDYTDPVGGMPNYLSLLNSYGVTPLEGVVVAGAEDTGSYYQEQIYLLPYMQELDMTLNLLSAGMDVLLMPGACAFETSQANDNSLAVAAVLKTGPNAYVRNVQDGSPTIDRQPDDISGELTVAVYANRMHYNGNVSRFFAVGNSTMFTDEYAYQVPYVEEFLITLMGELAPNATASLDIMVPAAFRPAMTAGSLTAGVALVVALPLVIVLLALCVLLPRRNR